MATANNSQFEELYRLAEYVVEDGPVRFEMYVGEECAALERLLEDSGSRSWAFLSAHNPRSTVLAADENAVRHADLIELLESRGYRFYAGYGHKRDGSWTPEASVLIVGIARAEAVALARRFDQHAILFGTIGSASELVWCSE